MAESSGHTEVVQATPERIVEALMSFESYPTWQSGIVETIVLERDDEGRGSIIEMCLDAKLRKLRVVVRAVYDDPAGLRWELVRGDVKHYEGRYTFVPLEDGSTRVSLDIEFELGFAMPNVIKNFLKEQALATAIRELKEHVEAA